ncbi:MAG: cohesin domain-containing protein [Dehalococcoidia bacterium]
MKVNVKIAIIAFLIVIAINITVVIVQFAGKSPTSTSTLQPGDTAIATPTYQPGSTAYLDATPTATYPPTATSAPGQTPVPTSSSPTPGPTQTATPTATLPGATPTPEPTSTPSGGGGGGGTLPTSTTTPTATPTSTQTLTTVVSISTASQVQRDSQFSVDINIEQATYLTFAYFDLSFNANIIEMEGSIAVNWGSQFNPTKVFYQIMESGLIRVVWDNADWANNENNGYGASGSGMLCRVTFTAVAAGTSQLSFVEGRGSPVGEHTLIRWMAWVDSVIPNVGWTNGSVTVVN